MNKSTKDEARATFASSRGWSPLARRLVSAALLFHCASVVAGVFGVPPFSNMQRGIKEFFLPYHEWLDQGYSYRYFAPEPPPTPILIAKLIDKDGRTLQEVRVPERGITPRMRYQRQLAVATALAIEVDQSRNSPDHPAPFWANSFAKSLGRRNPACVRVELFQEIHLIPDLGRIRDAILRGEKPPDLDAPEFYSARDKIGDYACDPNAP